MWYVRHNAQTRQAYGDVSQRFDMGAQALITTHYTHLCLNSTLEQIHTTQRTSMVEEHLSHGAIFVFGCSMAAKRAPLIPTTTTAAVHHHH